MIAARDLSLSLHGTPILRGLSFEVAPGEVFGLIGESGSGKSMTALALMGLAPRGAVVSGQVHLGETELTRLPDRRLRALRGNRIGMIFQEPMTALNPVQTIGAQVAETLVIHGRAGRAEALRQARDRLDRVGLQKIPLDRYPHQLSGGQRQRVCIAMAVALRPELLIADEPTTALDVTTQARILDLLRGLVAEDGMGLMLITHDLGVVAGMADRLAVMQDGRIVEQGTAGDVIAAPAHGYTRALFRAAGHQPEPVQATPGAPVLEAERLERLYPAPPLSGNPPTHALRGVSLRLHQGESLGLVGESGCGKSTLARALLGLDPVQGGRLSLFGQDATAGLPNRLRAGIQVVFQDPYGSFNPRWRVERLVAEPFHLMPGRPADWRARVGRALGDVGLSPEDRHRFIHEFSGGQRQRIAIARALITEPRIVVLDEAVSALDVQVRAQILDLLADLRARLGLSYLFISHDLNVVRRITDRVMVMRAGEIVETGPTGKVFAAPSHAYTKELVAATPALPPQWAAEAQDD